VCAASTSAPTASLDQEGRRVMGAVPDKDLDSMTEEEFIVALTGGA
jgi:hypothetical protein